MREWKCRHCARSQRERFQPPSHPDMRCIGCDAIPRDTERISAGLRVLTQLLGALAVKAPSSRLREEAPLLTAAETAVLLGTTPQAVYAMAARGQLPGVFKHGRRFRVRRSALVAWLEESGAPSPRSTKR